MAKKAQLSHKDIEKRLKIFTETIVPVDEIGYQLLYSFGKSEADIRRYKEGKGILKSFDGLLIKGLFCYRPTTSMLLMQTLEQLKDNVQVIKASPNIIAVSDGETILAYDTEERETFERSLIKLCYDYAFFYPLMGIKKYRPVDESPADRRAAEKLAKLHDELRAYNEFSTDCDIHDLNIFIARLLFCFFAEDSGIFEKDLFTRSIIQYTNPDGSDISEYLDDIFNIMDLKERREDTAQIVSQFPYVNGGLFSKRIKIPRMGQRARKIIIECGGLDWQDINPDIFGSMIQAVVNPDERANQGMHYTSVPNILKVINPLFLDNLRATYQELKDIADREKRMFVVGSISKNQLSSTLKNTIKSCKKLLSRMSKIKFFDPACGSGNFLIITYKMLRILEMDIFKLIEECSEQKSLDIFSSCISLEQFFGIELLDFPHEVAMLSLWLAEHQMNVKLFKEFGVNTQALPLRNITQIVCGNACRLNWNSVCPHTTEEEVYIFGNPPYLGSRNQDGRQKADMEVVFKNDYGSLDLIAAWFLLGAKYIANTNAKCAFVSTNSICQGLQVGLLWERIFELPVEIAFAYQSFKWKNNAKYNAAVTVVIIGLTSTKVQKLLIDSNNNKRVVSNITPYLNEGASLIVKSENQPISAGFPQMNFGNMPADGGLLLFSTEEKNAFIIQEPNSSQFFRPIFGSEEFINGKERWALWLAEHDVEDFSTMPLIQHRINKVREIRRKSSRPQLSEIPHLFAQITQPQNINFIIVPSVSSETREYIPMGYLDKRYLASNLCMVVGTDDISIFGILSSRIHMVWVKIIGGKLKTDYRYSAKICYNTFPFPNISEKKKQQIAEAAENILIMREGYPDKTLATLYDPEKMPDDLRKAHHLLDDVVESCYPGYPFTSDEARLESLFKLYEKLTGYERRH